MLLRNKYDYFSLIACLMYIDKFTYHVDNDVDYCTYVDNFTFLWNQNQNIYST